MMKMKLSQRIGIKIYSTSLNTTALISPAKAAEKAFGIFCSPTITSVFPEPDIFKKAEKKQLQLDGLQIYGWYWKQEKQNRPKVLIAHGFNSCSFKFEKYVLQLLKNGFEVLAFDAPAHGKSEGKQVHALMYKELILKINYTYGNLYGIIGHSFGGLAASFAAESLPELKKLVLIAPATETTTAISQFFKLLKLKEDIRPEFEKKLISLAKLPLSYFSAIRSVSNISVNTLWLHDTMDLICPFEDASKIRDLNLNHVQFYETTGLGHNKIYRDQSVSKLIIKFVSMT